MRGLWIGTYACYKNLFIAYLALESVSHDQDFKLNLNFSH